MMQVWPRLTVEPNHAAFAAIGTSASGSTNIASQPESSMIAGTKCPAQAWRMFFPVEAEPVKTTLSTPAASAA